MEQEEAALATPVVEFLRRSKLIGRSHQKHRPYSPKLYFSQIMKSLTVSMLQKTRAQSGSFSYPHSCFRLSLLSSKLKKVNFTMIRLSLPSSKSQCFYDSNLRTMRLLRNTSNKSFFLCFWRYKYKLFD